MMKEVEGGKVPSCMKQVNVHMQNTRSPLPHSPEARQLDYSHTSVQTGAKRNGDKSRWGS